jgi:hypothetical protein
MLENPENVAKINAIIEEIDGAYAEFAPLREKLAKLEAHRETLLKAAEASEEEAGKIREEMKDIMRATAGKPDRALLEKQASYRSALEMAEDYKTLAQETEAEEIEIRCQIHPGADRLKRAHDRLDRTFARLVLKEALAGIRQSLKIAYDFAVREYNSSNFTFRPHHVAMNDEEIIQEILSTEIWKATDLKGVTNETPDFIRNALKKRGDTIKTVTPAYKHVLGKRKAKAGRKTGALSTVARLRETARINEQVQFLEQARLHERKVYPL